MGGIFAQLAALSPPPDIAVFPETAPTGYFVEGGVRDLAVTAEQLAADLNDVFLAAAPMGQSLDVVIGFYELWNNTLHNSALYATLGENGPLVRHVHRKVFLPTYGVFDEERFVERGFEVRAFDTDKGRMAMLICEDVWHSITGTLAALDGARIIFVVSASPARGIWPSDEDVKAPASLHRWERLARDIAEEHGVFVALAHLVGNEGGKGFAGGSIVTDPAGDVRVRAPLWHEAILTVSLDLEDITRARADLPLLADLRTMLPHLLKTASHTIGPLAGAPPPALPEATASKPAAVAMPRPRVIRAGAPNTAASTIPIVSADDTRIGPPPLEIDPELVTEWLTAFLREEFSRRLFKRAVVGVSGGVDSALTAALCARALGPENVIGIRMPYRTSSPVSLEHGQLVIDTFGLTGTTVDITGAVDGYLELEPEADGTRRGNVMARTRMIVLFDHSAKHRALPVGTGNKTERLFGYFTWHADDSPPINPLGDLFKTQVWALARHLGVPDTIVSKPATADLVHGQTDEGDFGISYQKADQILNWLVHGYSPADAAEHGGFTAAEVEIVRRRLAGTHWKRRLPTVAMLSQSAIGESYLRPVDY
jgi:NAD+ synthase (glutamine-hydrolysing)